MPKKHLDTNEQAPVLSIKDVRLEWHEETRPLGVLKDNPKNPRYITRERFDQMVNSIKEDGYHDRIKIDLHNRIVGGHQRKKALIKAGWSKDDLLEVLVPNRELTQREFDALTIRSNVSYGEYDKDMLANEYEIADLLQWGVRSYEFDLTSDIGIEEEKPKKDPKATECPKCGHRWVKE